MSKRTDRERIDWLERMANEPDGIHLHDGGNHCFQCCGLGLRPGALVRTLRQAIDEAMGNGRKPR